MLDSLYIAWKYIRFHKLKTAILIAVISLTFYLPAGVEALVDETTRQLRLRASKTPLLIGAKGSEAELVLNSLYFDTKPPAEMTMAASRRVKTSGYAEAVPLYVRFRARDKPIVGTTLEYFSFRGLQIKSGRQFAILGECVVGAEIASELGVKPGDSMLSQSENFFDLAGVYPLKMKVVGVLRASGTPDDTAVFVDLKTAWIIAGLGHGHQDLAQEETSDSILSKEGNRLTANASVQTYAEITEQNAASFHFHGNPSTFPVTAIIALPHDRRSKTLLVGQFQSASDALQIVQPTETMERLLASIIRVRTFVLAGSILLGTATVLSVILVFALSLRIRAQEIATMQKIGIASARLVLIIAWEILLVVVSGIFIALVLALLTRRFSAEAIQWFLL